MATKNKKIKKTMIIEIPKAEAPEGRNNEVAALLSMQASAGWAILLNILEENIKYLEKAILDKVDPLTQAPIDDKEIENLRVKRGLNIELRDTPKNYIKKLQPDEAKEGENFDPYPKTAEDLRHMNNTTRSLTTEKS